LVPPVHDAVFWQTTIRYRAPNFVSLSISRSNAAQKGNSCCAALLLLPDVLRCKFNYDGQHDDQCRRLDPMVIGKTAFGSGSQIHC